MDEITRCSHFFPSVDGLPHVPAGPRQPDRLRGIGLTVVLLAAAFVGLTNSRAFAQDWAVKMFDHTSHDFGVVARGAKVEHKFIIENIYEEDAHIASVRSSCLCTTAKLKKNHLKTWEKAELVATLDTRSFLGQKDATLTVVFDQPFPAEVQLQVHSYIRSDVVVQPGGVEFGSVSHGTTRERQLTISYAGRADWQIEAVECSSPHVDAELQPLERQAGQATYRLTVRLKDDAPVGYVNDTITLVTNDANPRAARVPIAVEGLVTPAVAVRPSPLMLGVLQPGQTVTRQLVIHGEEPFQLVDATSDDPRLTARCNQTASKKVHVVPVVFTADATAGEVADKLVITTDLEGAAEVAVEVQAMVVGADGASPSGVSPGGTLDSGAAGIPAQPGTEGPGASPPGSPGVR